MKNKIKYIVNKIYNSKTEKEIPININNILIKLLQKELYENIEGKK